MIGRKLRWILVSLGVFAGIVILIVIVFGVLGAGDGRQSRRLADGSVMMIEAPVFTSTNYLYKYESGNRFVRRIAFMLPSGMRKKMSWSSGSLGWGIDSGTNLLVVSITKPPGKKVTGAGLVPGRLRIADESGNVFDTCWGASMLGMTDATVHGWQIRAFPRRSRTLKLQFLGTVGASGGSLLMSQNLIWTNLAEFTVRNPAYGKWPQWQAEPIPTTKVDGSLAVTLAEFQSGGRMRDPGGTMPESTVARKTRLVFTFAESGATVTNWMLQKLTISDAAGNKWFPYLDFVHQDFSWANQGTVEFFGALWPGEQAWKLKAEVVRTSGVQPDESWEVLLELPTARTVNSLTNQWEREGHTVKLVALASPNTDHTGDFKWTAKWWGEDRPHVYSLALKVDGPMEGWRTSVLGASDENGEPIKIMQHGNQDYHNQAVFFRPASGARQARLTFALQHSHFFEFLARPEFVTGSENNRLSKIAQ